MVESMRRRHGWISLSSKPRHHVKVEIRRRGTDRLGKYLEAGFPTRAHEDYAVAYSQSDKAGLSAYSVKNIKNALWSVPQLNPPDLVQADILHNILLGILNHLMHWIQGNLYNVLL